MEATCLFCLDPIKENNTRNPIGCQCAVHAHESCIHAWFQQKQQIECPICHTVSIPNPVSYENIQIVYIERPEVQETRRYFRANEKAIALCCCVLLGWSIGLTIVEAVWGRG